MPTIAIQGFEGSFHHAAAISFFGSNVIIAPCKTFSELIEVTSSASSMGGLMAIENSIAGSILPNYNLLHRSDLSITGEIYLQINQQLLVCPGVQLDEIKEVHSHPMALQQCHEFLDKYHWKLVETDDTALSAQRLSDSGSRNIAVIASSTAAGLYQLETRVSEIQTLKNNYTRFLVLSLSSTRAADADKASVSFHTDHSKGSLARVLSIIAGNDINLSKLQSFPIPGTEFKYNFHADMEFESLTQFDKMINDLKSSVATIRIYGLYKRGKCA